MYITADEVYATAGISTAEVSEENINIFIKSSEGEVDRLTQTTYWKVEATGTASSATDDTLTLDTASWLENYYTDNYVWIYSGTGIDQVRKILSNTETTLTLEEDWDTNPDNTSKFRIVYTHSDPHVAEELRDGNDTDSLLLYRYPLIALQTLTSNSTSVTLSSVYKYKPQGKITLSSTSEVSYFTSSKAQKTTINYWYGVYPMPEITRRLTMVYAALKSLMAQAGGTFNVPSTYALPEGSLTIGQAYINIRGAWDMLDKERKELERSIVKYPYFG